MKKLILISLLCLAEVSLASIPLRRTPEFCLEMSGRIFSLDGETNRYKVELIENHQVVDSVYIIKGGTFNFLIKKDTRYLVRIIKNGKEVKTVKLRTNNPMKDYEKSKLDFFEGIENDGLNSIPQSIVSFKARLGNYGSRDYAGHFSKLVLASN